MSLVWESPFFMRPILLCDCYKKETGKDRKIIRPYRFDVMNRMGSVIS